MMRHLRPLVLSLALAIPRGLSAQAAVPAVTLEEAIRMAERVQPSVVQAQGSIRNAEAGVRASWGSYLPTVTANSSGSQNFSEFARPDPVTGEITSGNTTSRSVNMALSASVDLFTGFQRGADMRAARANTTAAEANLVDARFQTRLNVTQEYFNALSSMQLVAVREASVRRAEEQLKISVAKLSTGSATRSDSLRSLVTLGNARLQLVNTQAALAQAQANLGRLIGVDGRVAPVEDSTLYAEMGVADTASLLAEATAQSPRVQSAEASADAAAAQLKAAKSDYWPSLSLSGSYSYSGSNTNDYQLFNQRNLTLRLSWPLFNGFSRERSITVQVTNAETANAQAADARRQIRAQLTAQLANLDAARLRIEITRTSVRAAEEDLRVQRERYRLGAATIVEVLTSQEALDQAEADVVSARFDYLQAKAQIEALIGRPL
jgi:outer membrane protein TolC